MNNTGEINNIKPIQSFLSENFHFGKLIYFFFAFLIFFFHLFRAAPAACGGSQAGGEIGAVASGLCQSHSNSGSKPHLPPTLQLIATLDP